MYLIPLNLYSPSLDTKKTDTQKELPSSRPRRPLDFSGTWVQSALKLLRRHTWYVFLSQNKNHYQYYHVRKFIL